ncbi:MAG TPA: nucleoside triphosphate pyrophosphohydrolase [Dehalococcoidia bacterium]|nr:nucleoside triphosphate pyrophosphohydrolase [Dehalococcoidia bacterium]
MPTEKQMRTFAGLWQVVKTLRAPGGCPWDRVQTHQSLRHFLLEESSEAMEALDEVNSAKLSEELGDVLFQVLIHSAIAEEQGEFRLGDVIEGIATKLVRRHPHVFGDTDVTTADGVIEQWEDLKRQERDGGSALTGIPAALPALSQAQTIQRRAGKAGFEWESAEQAWEALREELDELRAAERPAERSAEAGDALFALANLVRYLDVDAEEALRGTCRGFGRLFREVETMADERSLDLKETDIDTKIAMWEEAKKRRQAERV